MTEPSATARWLGAAFRVALRVDVLIYICLAALPLRYLAIGPGLDFSWVFAMNYAHEHGLVFGKNAGLTYGPLGYLTMPMPIGRNLGEGLLFQLGLWLTFMSWLAWRRKAPLARLVLLAAGLAMGADSFRAYGVDTFLVFLALLFLGSALVEPRWDLWHVFYGGALALSALLFFIKFNSAIGTMAAVGLFTAALFLSDRRRACRAALGLALWPFAVIGIACFLLEPSPAVWWRYVRLGLEFASGYSATLSSFGPPRLALLALLVLVAWAAALGVLYWRKASSWPLAFACLGPLFLEFKHSFVREPGHSEIFFVFLPLVWAVVAFHTEFRGRNGAYLAVALALPAAAWLPHGKQIVPRLWDSTVALDSIRSLEEILPYGNLRRRLVDASVQLLAPDRLPPALVARVGDRSIVPFPWECVYVAANRMNMRLFPGFQMYAAYTPFLDSFNAAFLEDSQRAPEFILFDWDTIDDRHPLLDVPATTLAMYRHYDFDSMYGAHMLLHRRGAPRFGGWRPVETRELHLTEPLAISPRDHPATARIYLRWNMRGKLRKLFFRVPEVRLIASSAHGRVLSVRVPPGVMEDGVPLDFLPFDLEEARALFAGEPLAGRLEALSIGGPGARYLEPVARVEIEEAPDVTLSFAAPPTPGFSHLQHLGPLESCRLDRLNDAIVLGLSQLTLPDTRGSVDVQGWAMVNNEAAGGVWIDIDGKARPARYGLPRRDVGAFFHLAEDLPCGFEGSIPVWELGKTWHELSVRILTRDGSGYYDGARKLRFRIE